MYIFVYDVILRRNNGMYIFRLFRIIPINRIILVISLEFIILEHKIRYTIRQMMIITQTKIEGLRVEVTNKK